MAITTPAEKLGPPTSAGQRRMWLLHQLEAGRTVYNVVLPIRLCGELDRSALAGSLTDLVARHEILRTTYRTANGEPFAVVRTPEPVALPVADLTGLDRFARAQAVEEACADQENEPFDLETGPIIRAELLRLAHDEHVLLICVHHIAMDAASRPVLLGELAAGYNARRAGGAAELPGLPAQYADYAARQVAELSGPRRDEQLGYWRRQLDRLPTLDLPTDRTAPEVPSGDGGFTRVDLEDHLLESMRGLARDEGAEPVSVLVAAVQALLYRYTGQEDFAVGTTLDGRDRPELRDLIGYFANTVVLRADVSGAPTFREMVRRADRTLRDAVTNSGIPFDTLVQELAPERTAGGRSPFFRVYTGAYDSSEEALRFDGLEARALPSEFSTARFDLGLVLDTTADGTTLDCSFDLDLFDDATAERLLGHLLTLLESGLERPDAAVTGLRMLTGPELHDVLVTWNDTAEPFDEVVCLHQLFEGNARARGDLVAVACGAESLTYAELDARANRLAHRLRALGVGRDVLVGVCMPRSVWQAVAVLGVLKAGGAFLPVDPDYPADRVEFMLSDSGAWGVITSTRTETGIDAPNVLVVDSGDLDAEPAEPVETDVTSDDLAFVMYTSGSTGRPKGIALRHQGAVNNYTDFNRRFEVGPGDSVLGVSSPSFDMSVYDMLGLLAAGGTLVLPEPEAVKEPARWAELMHEHRITIWHSAPALLELLVEKLVSDGATLPHLRLALLSGDWIAVGLPDRVRALAPVQVIALGGATEASMDSVIFPIGEVDPEWKSIPYGAPMANQTTYVLDPHGWPQPVGIPGELYIGGVGLARGYVNRPELTAERFVTHTFPDGTAARLYRTGDLARYRPDGVVELLGRMDFQVKVHGLRIELGEIEAALRKHPAVTEAVVVAQGERGNHTLAGFVTAEPGADRETLVGDLREHLLAVLPSHMVPAVLEVLDALPTTPNGKVDRKALSAREVAGGGGGQGPRNPLEARIASVWRGVLGTDDIGIDDDFFRIGGDSFAAVRAMLAIDSSVPVIELFKNPTIRALAVRLRTADTEPQRLLHELTPRGRQARITLVCLPYGGGNAIAYQPLADALPGDMALWALSQPGYDPSGSSREFRPFEEIVRGVADEVAQRIEGPVLVYGHCAGTAMAAALAPELEARGVDLRALYLAASLPEADPAAALAIERATGNEAWAEHLRSLGGLDGALEWATIDHVMVAGRHDHEGAMEFHLRSLEHRPEPIRAPIRCVFGDADPATEGWERRYTDWSRFGEVESADVIEGGRHYFVRDHAPRLAELIAERHAPVEAAR
ncbi:amino acid adenylation domain-containing protein [Microbispora sp. RL4-1S]|uniref:Amino acid adenylation domain-containing protein n=1 Tax=Microbispora oryzae TaxID=2806554 RepID=A0A940WEN4_9ACTN|nr:non-ribosomal peptide synthetase [Microbispora oryzae]MBP2703238.1 amino acid adenylation domain-containing protein [Microbispora oryzae]